MRSLVALPLLLIVGCADPLSNARIYDDATFVAALPSEARFGPPTDLTDAPVGSSLDLTLALAAADDLDALLHGLVLVSEAIRASQPDVREDNYRLWDLVPVVTADGEAYWARVEMTRPVGGSTWWTLDVAPDRIGPWVQAASGTHSADGSGNLATPASDASSLSAVYMPDVTGRRDVTVRLGSELIAGTPERLWNLVGRDQIAWTGRFDVQGESLPGVRIAVASPGGGRADGWVAPDGATLSLWTSSCWDSAGDPVWSGGDPPSVETGDPDACVLPRLSLTPPE